ncbi:MAG TPA: OpgC domain-containing protein [Casimicrobiaceae bacterium]|nr:OpgC domain-containing protein [Casimicrobiaceae bacterium]
MERQTDLDWLRGMMLVLMTITHLPTWFSAHAGQPFGFVSAAEGFVFLSAFLVGSVYTRTVRTRGLAAMRRALWARTLKVYAAHVALLLFLLFLLVPVALTRGAHEITDLASFYVAHPHVALASGVLLAYNPPLLDILPMYVVFLAVSPLALEHALRRGWGGPLAFSAALWLIAQHGVERHVYESVAALVDWPVPYSQTGAFSWLAWQLLWMIGLRAGAMAQSPALPSPAPARPAYAWAPGASLFGAAAIAGVFFVWRHTTGQTPFGSDSALNMFFDKWHLGPLRLLNFAVLAILVVRGRSVLVKWAERSSLATLGRASLTVFSAHLLLCLGVLAVVGAPIHSHPGPLDAALLAGTLAALYVVARLSLSGERALRARWGKDRKVLKYARVSVSDR